MSPEQQILFCCARVQLNEDTACQLQRLVQQEIDWVYLQQLSQTHRLKPLLFWHLKRHAIQWVPCEVFDDLKQAFYDNAWLNHHLSSQVVKIVQLLESYNIRALSFKGVSLAASAYQNVALRQAGDIDLMVHRDDAVRALEILCNEGGFRSPLDKAGDKTAYLRNALHFHLYHPDIKTTLELHWELMPPGFPYRPDFNVLWNRRSTTHLAHRPMPDLAPADLLIYLSLHGGRHQWSSLRWVVDIAELLHIHQATLDWSAFSKQVCDSNNQRMIWLGFYLAHHWLEAPVPQTIKDNLIADNQVVTLARKTYHYLAIDSPLHFPNEDLQRWLYHLQLLERWVDRLRYVHYTLAPYNSDVITFAVPPYLSFLYYLIRPWNYLKKWIRFQIRFKQN